MPRGSGRGTGRGRGRGRGRASIGAHTTTDLLQDFADSVPHASPHESPKAPTLKARSSATKTPKPPKVTKPKREPVPKRGRGLGRGRMTDHSIPPQNPIKLEPDYLTPITGPRNTIPLPSPSHSPFGQPFSAGSIPPTPVSFITPPLPCSPLLFNSSGPAEFLEAKPAIGPPSSGLTDVEPFFPLRRHAVHVAMDFTYEQAPLALEVMNAVDLYGGTFFSLPELPTLPPIIWPITYIITFTLSPTHYPHYPFNPRLAYVTPALFFELLNNAWTQLMHCYEYFIPRPPTLPMLAGEWEEYLREIGGGGRWKSVEEDKEKEGKREIETVGGAEGSIWAGREEVAEGLCKTERDD